MRLKAPTFKRTVATMPAGGLGLALYLTFTISWFLHFGIRIPVLGLVRFDLILVCILALLAVAQRKEVSRERSDVDKWLKILIAYAVLTIPLVEWPGSAIRNGIPEFTKAVVFYYFTVAFVRTEGDLKKFVAVFVGCQLFRVLEPLYLHITQGYWGSFASMNNWEYLNRLSGAPDDVVNPNGLAFIICTVLPFLYFLAGNSLPRRILAGCLIASCIYALTLTGSRSGMLGLLVIFAGIVMKSRAPLRIATIGALAVVFGFPLLSADMQDRYLSIVGMGAKNEGTAEGRLQGTIDTFEVSLRRPVFGHGLGTSREANANFAASDQPAHNLYAEVAQEIGFLGLVIFLILMKSILSAYARCRRAIREASGSDFLRCTVDALEVWLWMTIIFSLASYGLSSYEWYLLGGFAVVIVSLTRRLTSGHPTSDTQRTITPNDGTQTLRRDMRP